MKVLLIAALVALASADVSHLQNQQPINGYQYQGPQGVPQTSYGIPQSSVLGGASQTYSQGSLSLPSGSSVEFNSGFSTPAPSGVSIQYNGYSTPSPIGLSYSTPSANGLSYSTASANGLSYSTPSPIGLSYSTPSSIGLGSFQSSTPAPGLDLSSFQGSSPAPLDLSNYQVSGQSANLDLSGLSGFQVSTPSSIPSVNLVQYSQPTSSSFQFLSGLSQQGGSVPSFGLSSVGSPQFTSDASLNSGINFGAAQAVANSFVGQTSGGSLDDAFGVVTNAASGAASESESSKHLYFFAAPEDEEEEVQAKIELPPQPPKKTYKIIFIKAPAYRNHQTITIPAAPQNDEKTLVYVLVKKPEGQPKVRFQDAAPTQPSKPEVFFIKYKTQKEAEAAVAEIQNKHGASGHVIANLPAGSQTAIQPDHIVSVSTTVAPDLGLSAISGGVSLESLGGDSYVSSTPANFEAGLGGDSFVSSTPSTFEAGLGGDSFVSSTPASFDAGFSQVSQGPEVTIGSQHQEVQDAGLQLTVGGISEDVSTHSVAIGSSDSSGAEYSSLSHGEESSVADDIQNAIGDQAEGFKQYGPPNLKK